MPKYINHKDWTRDNCDSGWQMSWIQVCNNYIRKLPLHERFPNPSSKTAAIIQKRKFDDEANRQNQIRKNNELKNRTSAIIIETKRLTPQEWLHQYNLEPEPNFHYL